MTNLSSRGLRSRLRGSTRSGNWTIDCHSRLRKLEKSVLSLGSVANFSCSRNRTPTSPLSVTSQPGSALVPSNNRSSSSCSSFSVTNARRRFHHKRRCFYCETSSSYQPFLPPSPGVRGRPSRTLYCPFLWCGSWGSKQIQNTYFRHNHSIVGTSEITSHSHEKLNDCVPQRPEVDIEHCDEVTQRYLRAPSGGVNVKNPSQRFTGIYFLVIATYPLHKSTEMFAFIRILAPQQWIRRTCWKVDGGP